LLKKNVHPSIVAAQLGHASVSTTLDIYSHSIPALQELAASKFDDIIIGEKQSVR
jgi:integrase